MSNFNKVKIFMEKFGQEVKSKASFPDKKIQDLRYGPSHGKQYHGNSAKYAR